MKKYLYILLTFIALSSHAQSSKSGLPVTPKGVPGSIISHRGYTLSYNTSTNCPNWVAWELTDQETQGTISRSPNFFPDPDVPEANRVEPTDYRGSGYDRGHMCPAADMKWSEQAMHDCFYMSNICPQDRSLNGGAWERLETACRRWARQEGEVYIICGPIFHNPRKSPTIGEDHRVKVPDAFFKVILSLRPGHEKAIGFLFANDNSRQALGEVCCSVDTIEELTGYDFFPKLDKNRQSQLESTFKLSKWN